VTAVVGEPFWESPWWTDETSDDLREWIDRAADGLGLGDEARSVAADIYLSAVPEADRSKPAAIAAALVVSPASVEKYVTSIFTKLGLPASDADHRRVLAVLRYLGS
jgi:hypothetical protein